MAQAREINPILKQVLELGPTLAFFVLYIRIKDDTFTFGGTEYTGFIVAAVVFVPILLIASVAFACTIFAALAARDKKVSV